MRRRPAHRSRRPRLLALLLSVGLFGQLGCTPEPGDLESYLDVGAWTFKPIQAGQKSYRFTKVNSPDPWLDQCYEHNMYYVSADWQPSIYVSPFTDIVYTGPLFRVTWGGNSQSGPYAQTFWRGDLAWRLMPEGDSETVTIESLVPASYGQLRIDVGEGDFYDATLCND